MTVQTSTTTKIYESLIHCETCSGNQWRFENDIPIRANCWPVAGDIEVIPCKLRHFPYKQRQKLETIVKGLGPDDQRLWVSFNISFMAACQCYADKIAWRLRQDCRDDIQLYGLTETMRLWTPFIKKTLNVGEVN